MSRDFNDWNYIEISLFDGMASGNAELENDRFVQALYDTALFNHDISPADRAAVMDTLKDYMWDEYGLNFDDVFDWDGYRAAYDNNGV